MVKPTYNEKEGIEISSGAARFRFIKLLEVWILGTVNVSAKHKFPVYSCSV
jgi:hypothetical protein